MSDSLKSVKKGSTPLTGGPSSMGLQASMMGFPARLAALARLRASAATFPLTASTSSSPKAAASAKLPRDAEGFCAAQSASLPGDLEPTFT